MKVFEVGGQEVVTLKLAESFAAHGHNVYIASFKRPSPIMTGRADKRIVFFTLGEFSYSKTNVIKLRSILVDNNIDIVINQWGLPYIPAKVLDKAKSGTRVKTISVYHNSPETNARIKGVEIALSERQSFLKRILLICKKTGYTLVTSKSMRYVYNHSDLYMVLSPSFVEKFKSFTGIKNPSRLVVQTNPVTVDASGYVYSRKNKIKEIIYVGRIDYNQKRVYRVINTWTLLEDRFPDWRLTIVGDGPERINLERKVQETGLRRVSFEGFQRPEKYYERASLLVLTSEYEGFPLVLAECMSYGVVPVVYGSYSAVYDIVRSGENGIVVEPDSGKFMKYKMADAFSCLMQDAELMNMMAINAIATSKDYSLDTVYESWNRIFSKLIKN